MGKKRPRSLLQRAAAAPRDRPPKRARPAAAQADGTQAKQQQQGRRQAQQQHWRQPPPAAARPPPGPRPVSVVHSQAAYAVRRLLEADASKRGGVTLKSLTLGPRVEAKKVRCGSGRSAGSGVWSPRLRPALHLGSAQHLHAPRAPATPSQATYAVTVETLRHLPVLAPLLERVGLAAGGDGGSAASATPLVLAYELLFGEGLRPAGAAERAVLQRKAELKQALAQLVAEAGAAAAADLLPRPGPNVPHPRTARVNTLRLSVDAALAWLREPPAEHRRKWAAVVRCGAGGS